MLASVVTALDSSNTPFPSGSRSRTNTLAHDWVPPLHAGVKSPAVRFVPDEAKTTNRPFGLMPPLYRYEPPAPNWSLGSPVGLTSRRVVVPRSVSRTNTPL